MSEQDRQRWNQRFNEGAYSQRSYPSQMLADRNELLSACAPGKALDIASGAGRNAIYLSELGFEVTAIDISEIGIEKMQQAADPARPIHAIAHDLEHGLPTLHDRYTVIVLMRYLNLSLVSQACQMLRHDGLLFCEVLLQRSDQGRPPSIEMGSNIAGPSAAHSGARFRAKPGDLAAAMQSLSIEHYFEGSIVDPDGREAHVAQAVGRKG